MCVFFNLSTYFHANSIVDTPCIKYVVKWGIRGLSFSLEWGVPYLQLSASIKLQPPPFQHQKFYDPPVAAETPCPLNSVKVY